MGAPFKLMETASGEPSNHRPVLLRSQTSAPTQLPWWCERNAGDEPLRLLRTCPRYAPTPLISLPGVAERLGLGEVWIKDETPDLESVVSRGSAALMLC